MEDWYPLAAAALTPGPLKHGKEVDINHLHVSLAHAHASVLKATAKQHGIHLTGELVSCSAYSRAKGHRAPTPHHATRRGTQRLGLVHIDTAGPYSTSIEGSRYVVMFADSASRLQRPYGVREKSAAAILSVVKRFVADMGVPRAFRTDKAFGRTKSQPAAGARARLLVSKESVVERKVGDTTGRERCEEAPVCKEPPAAQARGLCDQSKNQRKVCREFGGEPKAYSNITCQKAGTSSTRSTTPKGERWYVKYHRPRNRPRALQGNASVKGANGRRSATSSPSELQPREADLKWSRRLYDPSLKNSCGLHRKN